LMKAFADAFRAIVQAPYKLDNVVSANPKFEMKRNVDEAWVVVYGDDTLGEVTVDGPAGSLRADYAQDRRPGTGAYKVLYVRRPAAGDWTVRISGGTAGAAYAVIQRSALRPFLLEPDPRNAPAGTPVKLVAGIGADRGSAPTAPADLPEDLVVELEVGGRTVRMHDGAGGDAVPRDGRYTAEITFDHEGETPVTVHARSALLNASVTEKIKVAGMFAYRGGPIEIDLGTLHAPAESCRDFRINAQQTGLVPFELRPVRGLPYAHVFSVRGQQGALQAGGPTLALSPGEPLRLCLAVSRWANSSRGAGEHWLELEAASRGGDSSHVHLHVRWEVQGLPWILKWIWLILLIGALLLILLIVYGYVKPKRFPRNLAMILVPDYDDLDLSPRPLSECRGVGIGWYRDARAYLHPSFRIDGSARDALARLEAIAGGVQIVWMGGGPLERETTEGWEPVPAGGRRVIGGANYRFGDHGPYFRVSMAR